MPWLRVQTQGTLFSKVIRCLKPTYDGRALNPYSIFPIGMVVAYLPLLVPFGNTAVSIAMCLCSARSTLVVAGVSDCMRVVSVLPSTNDSEHWVLKETRDLSRLGRAAVVMLCKADTIDSPSLWPALRMRPFNVQHQQE